MSTEPHETPSFDPQRAFQLGVGVASPLWPAFTAAAAGGLAFWWWSKLARGERPELFAEHPSFAPAVEAVETIAKAAEPLPAALAEVMTAPAEAIIEAVAESAAVVEAAAELAVETVEEVFEATVETVEAVAESAIEPAEAVEVIDPVVEAPVQVKAAAPPPLAETAKPAVSRLDQSLAAWAATTPKTQKPAVAKAAPPAGEPSPRKTTTRARAVRKPSSKKATAPKS